MAARARSRLCPLLTLLLALGPAACGPRTPARPAGPGAATGPIDRVSRLPDPLPAVAARVNGQAVTIVRVASLARLREDRGTTETGPNPGVLRETLQQLVVRELLFQEALRRGIAPEARGLERAYDAMRAGESQEARWLARLADEGLTQEELKQELRIQATVAALLRALAPRLPEQVGDEEARAFLAAHPEAGRVPERLRLRQILLRLPPDASEADRAVVQQRAERLLARLRAGADFASLARSESQDDATRELGGDLGAVPLGLLQKSFEAVVQRLQPGELSDVMLSGLGFHILRLEQRLPAQELPFEALGESLRQAVVEAERKRAADGLVKQLEAQARIEVYL